MKAAPVETEVVVVGGGIAGCSIAYRLSLSGTDVVLLERDSVGAHASGRNAGGVRQQGRDPAELPLAMESIRMWQTLAEELDADLEYVRKGNINVALSDEEAEVLKGAVDRQVADGLDVQFLTGQEARDVMPALSDRVVGAAYCATDGHANPLNTILALGRAAVRAGVRLMEGVRATGISVVDGEVRGVETNRGFLSARTVVNAAGVWAAPLAATAGVKLPILSRRSQLLTTQPLPWLFDQFVTGNTTYCRQTLNGNVHIGGSGPWEALGHETRTSATTMSRYAARTSQVVPALAGVRALRTWAGNLQITPDLIPIIDAMQEPRGLVIVAGFSGHGFALGPAVGKVVSEWLIDGKPSTSLDAFRLDRFALEFDFAGEYRASEEPPARATGGLYLSYKMGNQGGVTRV